MKYLAILLLLVSCVTSQQELDPKVYYKNDICFKLKKGKSNSFQKFFNRFKTRKYRKKHLKSGEIVYCGVAVLPELEEYHLEIIADNRLDRLEMTSCHEDKIIDGVTSGVATISYIPTIEKGEACSIIFGGFSRKKKHAFGSLHFEDSSMKLEATLYCNGFVNKVKGVAVCQSKEGLLQRITFNKPVYVLNPIDGKATRAAPCPVLFEDGMTTKDFHLPNRDCIYGFIDKETKQRLRLNTFGYEQIIVR